MVLLGVGAVGIFDLFGRGVIADTQNFVIVFLGWNTAVLDSRGEAALRACKILGSPSRWHLRHLLEKRKHF